MGTWRITIDGLGCHHNHARDIDADLAAKDFVSELQNQGHTISAARFEMRDFSGGIYQSSDCNTDLLTGKVIEYPAKDAVSAS